MWYHPPRQLSCFICFELMPVSIVCALLILHGLFSYRDHTTTYWAEMSYQLLNRVLNCNFIILMWFLKFLWLSEYTVVQCLGIIMCMYHVINVAGHRLEIFQVVIVLCSCFRCDKNCFKNLHLKFDLLVFFHHFKSNCCTLNFQHFTMLHIRKSDVEL